MRRRLHFKVETKENIVERKRGFTLIELLAVIVIIGAIGGIATTAIISIINNSKESATLLAINNVKSAAELYSKENSKEIEWITQYKEDGTETGKFVCMTVRQLINNGYFDEDFFKEDIYHDRLNDNTYIEIKQGINSDNTKVTIHEDATTQNDCEISAINTTLSEIKLTGSESFTDQINFSVEPKEDIGEVEFSATYENDKKENIPGNCTNGNCTFDSLKNNTGYKIKVCMSPTGNNTNFTSTVCEIFGLATNEFEYPDITISNSKKWKRSKTVAITYSDENIRDKNGIHYFKSKINTNKVNTNEIKTTVTSGNIYECSSFENGENNVCNINVTKIKPDTWYKVDGEKVEFLIESHIGKGDNWLITARIQDQTGNYIDSKENVIRIDTKPPKCDSSGGNDSWTNEDIILTGTCSDEDSGCSKKIITKTVNYSAKGAVNLGKVKDKAGNEYTCPTQDVLVDKDPPKCNVIGGNDSSNPVQYKLSVTMECSDSLSGCKEKITPVTFKGPSSTNKSPGTVYDNAGNSKVCDSVGVYIVMPSKYTCGSVGSTTTYAGLKWYTVSNTNDYCELSLNSTSKVSGSYNNAYNNLVNSYFKNNGQDYNSTLAADFNNSYIISVDTNAGTNGSVSMPTQGFWWYQSGSVRVGKNIITKYLGDKTTLYSGVSYEGNKKKDGKSVSKGDFAAGDKYLSCKNGTEYKINNNLSVNNNSSSARYNTGCNSANGIFSKKYNIFESNSTNSNSTYTYFVRKLNSGNLEDGAVSQYVKSKELRFESCGGNYNGTNNSIVVKPNNNNNINVSYIGAKGDNNIKDDSLKIKAAGSGISVAGNNGDGSAGYQVNGDAISGWSSFNGNGDGKRVLFLNAQVCNYTKSNDSNHTKNKHNQLNGACQLYTYYTGHSTTTVNYYYRLHIKVKQYREE